VNGRQQQFSIRRLWALIRKEAIQIITDPSSILIAFILPVILLFLFGYAVSLDTVRIRIGVVLEERTPESDNLLLSLRNSRYLDVATSFDRDTLEREMVAGRIRGMLVVPVDFSRRTTMLLFRSLRTEANRIQRILFRTICRQRYLYGCNSVVSRRVPRLTPASVWKRVPGSILPSKVKIIWYRDRSRS
jgi:hypothetical protein